MFVKLHLPVRKNLLFAPRFIELARAVMSVLVLMGASFSQVATAAPFTLSCNITSYKYLNARGEMRSNSLLDLEPSTRTGSIQIDLENETCDRRRCAISDAEILQIRIFPDGTMESVINRITGQMVKSFYSNDGTLKREQVYACSKREAAF